MRLSTTRLILVLVCISMVPLAAQSGGLDQRGSGITSLLAKRLSTAGPNALIPVYARFDGLPTTGELLPIVRNMSKADRRAYVINRLRDHANASQAMVRSFLEEQRNFGRAKLKKQLWINNALSFEATRAVIEDVASMQGVLYINHDRTFSPEETLDSAFVEVPDMGAAVAAGGSNSGGGTPTANVTKINADQAWAKGYTGQGVLVAIIDSGTNYNHPDLVNNRWTNPDEIAGNGVDDDGNGYVDDFIGWDFESGNDNDPISTSTNISFRGHGTCVAGLVCGDGTSGTATGVAPDATFMVLKLWGAAESEWWESYQYAIMEGADVIASSYSLKWPSQPDYNAFRDAAGSELAAGLIHANSIGNQGTSAAHPVPFNVSVPGNCPPPWLHPDQPAPTGTNNHISAVMGCGNLTSGSNYETISAGSGVGPSAWSQCDADLTNGAPYPTAFAPYNDYPVAAGCSGAGGLIKPDVCAPGSSCTSLANNYLTGGALYTTAFGGTSGATPHLGGLMCLVLEANPTLTPEQVCRIIQTTAEQPTSDASPTKDNSYGAGRIDCLAAVCAAEITGPGVQRVLITELSSGNPDYAEIHNFTDAPIDLTGWTFSWKDGVTTQTSGLGSVVINPGQTICLVETSQSLPLPPTALQINLSINIGTSGGDFAAALMDPNGFVVDEVHVASVGGSYSDGELGGSFRGEVVRDGSQSTGVAGAVERIWGLDSDGGMDWTDQAAGSPGLENTSSGPRGSDTAGVYTHIKINEVDDGPDYIELYNSGSSQFCLPPPFGGCFPAFTNLKDWYLVIGDDLAFGGRTVVRPFPENFLMVGDTYLVIGDVASAPAELPGNGVYIPVSTNIPFASQREYSIVLYDNLGRVVDAMRTTAQDRGVVYNHPRMPSHWADFTGAALRSSDGDQAIGRDAASTDLNTGADWRAVSTRTMGYANSGFVAGNSGHGDILDVRGNEGSFPGNGATVILNAGVGAAGWSYGQMFSFTHSNGTGPFFGLGADAPTNWVNLQGISPYFGTLDSNGAARYDFQAGSLPPGLGIDCLFYITNGSSFRLTRILEFDT